ncbi:MAG: hypothetical protein ACJZ79_06890 [Pseudohongiellaceae bacterium]|nr:hypothetical protein [Gammaproteobacteria bacterium]|tara:strand:+ start:652 stop:1296 length:645 start_codon:yes stop_codon:yes gene_type:complete
MAKENYGLELFMDVTYTVSKFGFLRAATVSLLLAGASSPVSAEELPFQTYFVGQWVINDDLSDDTDDQVEEAIEAAGGDGGRGFFNREEDFYRGGPPEHELYDRLSYDDVLVIEHADPEIRFTYEDGYRRIFHTDGRRRRSTANDFYEGGEADWSEGSFEENALIVEARPRDGGYTLETYTLVDGGDRLRIEMIIQPLSFGEPIELVRYFDRTD